MVCALVLVAPVGARGGKLGDGRLEARLLFFLWHSCHLLFFLLLLVGCETICVHNHGAVFGVEGVRCSLLDVAGWFRRAVVVCCVLVPLVQND